MSVTFASAASAPSITVNTWGGFKLHHCRNTSEALAAAGMDWEVTQHPLFDETGPISGWKALRRSDTNAQLSVVGASYQPVQNRDAFKALDAFLGDIELDHALSLRGGRRVVLTARIGLEADVATNDPVESWLIIYNSHDGSLAFGTMFSSHRVICQNTLSWALEAQGAREDIEGVQRLGNVRLHRKRVTFKHTTNINRQVDRLPDLINLKKREFDAAIEEYRAMRATPCTTADFRQYLERVFHTNLWDANTRRMRPVESLRALPYLAEAFEDGIGAETARGTLWGAYNAITQWTTHERGKTHEDRAESNWFGAGATIITAAHRAALALV